jgi:mono/diheme cytochrome c family protein
LIRRIALVLLLAAGPAWATEPAQADYMLNCQGCHLPDGRGFPQRQVPDLRQQMGRFLAVPGGREYLVQVPGSAQSALDDEGLARVLNWMLHNFSGAELPGGFLPYSAAEVGQLRQQPLTNPSSIRVQLLVQIARQPTPPTGALSDE